jgi:hypothetical protein
MIITPTPTSLLAMYRNDEAVLSRLRKFAYAQARKLNIYEERDEILGIALEKIADHKRGQNLAQIPFGTLVSYIANTARYHRRKIKFRGGHKNIPVSFVTYEDFSSYDPSDLYQMRAFLRLRWHRLTTKQKLVVVDFIVNNRGEAVSSAQRQLAFGKLRGRVDLRMASKLC